MTACLIYHDVVAIAERDRVGFPGRLAGRYKHTPEQFGEHLSAIAQTGRPVGLWPADGCAADRVVLTFDDGGASALAIADGLEAHGWRGHFFITTQRIGEQGFLGADGVRELAARGHDVGSHSHTHPPYIGRLPPSAAEREWTESREILTGVLGDAPDTAAVPGGQLGPSLLGAVRAAGYTTLMTSEPIVRHRRVDGLQVVGRFTIWDSTPPQTAAAYAREERAARARLWAQWRLKRLANNLSPRAYDALRRVRAGGR